MPPRTLEEIRVAFAKRDPQASGKCGERFARQWFRTNEWDFEDIDQSRGTKPVELRTLGGKRPDFVVDSRHDSIITTVDAKFATTGGGKAFAMPNWEIEQYRKFVVFAESKFPGKKCEVFFMIFPKEDDGRRFVWIDLNDFGAGSPAEICGEPATAVSLSDRPELWCACEA
jgi:hypothetical protein